MSSTQKQPLVPPQDAWRSPVSDRDIYGLGASGHMTVTTGVCTSAGFSGDRVWSGEESDSDEMNQRAPKLRLANLGVPHGVDGGEWVDTGGMKDAGCLTAWTDRRK